MIQNHGTNIEPIQAHLVKISSVSVDGWLTYLIAGIMALVGKPKAFITKSSLEENTTMS